MDLETGTGGFQRGEKKKPTRQKSRSMDFKKKNLTGGIRKKENLADCLWSAADQIGGNR